MHLLIYQNTTVHQCTSEHLDACIYLDKLIHIHINIYSLVHKIGEKKGIHKSAKSNSILKIKSSVLKITFQY